MARLFCGLILLATCALLVNCDSQIFVGSGADSSGWKDALQELLSPLYVLHKGWQYLQSYFVSEIELNQPLGKPCNPNVEDGCTHGSKCNPRTNICDCADSYDGKWRRTFQNNECRLLPGSTCVPRTDQDFYRCVKNSECTVTRQGVDPRTCLADAPCDTGDYECICLPGKNCLSRKVSATPL